MFAGSSDRLNNVSVGFERLSDETYTEYAYQQLSVDTMEDYCAQMGFVIIQLDSVALQIGNDYHPGIYIAFENEESIVYQKQIYIKCDEYMVVITITSFGEDRTDEILSYFSSNDD